MVNFIDQICVLCEKLEVITIRIQDIKVGNWYRLKNTSGEYCDYYGWIKVIEVFKRGAYGSPDKKKPLVKCRHVVSRDDSYGFTRYFSPSDIVNTDECKKINSSISIPHSIGIISSILNSPNGVLKALETPLSDSP